MLMDTRSRPLMKNDFRKYAEVMKTAMQNSTVYSRNFIFGSLFLGLVLFMFLQLWEKVSGEKGMIAGYSLNRLLWYYTIAEIVTLTRSDIMARLNQDIRSGDIAVQLLRPYHYLNSLYADAIGQMILRLSIHIPIGCITAFALVGPLEGFRFTHLPIVMLSVILGLFISVSMEALIGLTAFWTEDNTAFWWISQKLAFMLGLFLPLEILPVWLQRIAIFLPYPYMVYAPARIMSTFTWPTVFRLIPVQIVYMIVLFTLSHVVYKRGSRNIQSNGG